MAKKIEVQIVGDASSLTRALNSAERSSSNLGSRFATLGKAAVIGLGAVGVGAGLAGKRMIEMASDAAEVQSKMEVIFGRTLPGLTKNLDAFAKATGASRFELREQVADMGALLEPLTANKQAAANMSEQFVKLATDLGSFNNVPVADALLAIRSGLVGESEPLRRFGVLLNEAAVNQEGLRLGLIKGKEAMTEQEKVMARASLIMKQTTLAQGDATRTADSLANQIKNLKNNISDFATDAGAKLAPLALRFTEFLNKIIEADGMKAKLRIVWEGIESVASELASKLSNALGGVDFTEVGRTIVTKIKDAIDASEQPVNESADALVKKFNTALENANWEEIGQTWAQKLRQAIREGGDGSVTETQSTVDRMRAILANVPGLGILMRIPTDTLSASFRAVLLLQKGFYSDMLSAAQTVWEGIKIKFLEGVSSLAGLLAKIPGPFQDNFKAAKRAAEKEIAEIKLDQMIRRINDQATEATPAGKKTGEAVKAGFTQANLPPFMQGKIHDAITQATEAGKGAGRVGGQGVGNAIGMGMAAGVSATTVALVGATTAAVHAAIFAGSKAARAGSPSKETEEKIGVPLGQGVIVGWIKSSAPLPEKMSEGIKRAIEKARAAIEASRERLGSAFDGLAARILRAFDAETAAMETASEKRLREIDERRQMEDLIQAQTDAQQRLTEAIKEGDAAAIARAQRDLDRATEDIQKVDLQKQAEQERIQLDSQNEERRLALEKRLNQLKAHFEKEGATTKQAMAAIAKIMRDFEVDFAAAGTLLGNAFASALQKAIAAAAKAAVNVNAAVPGAPSGFPAASPQSVQVTVPVMLDGQKVGQSSATFLIDEINRGSIKLPASSLLPAT